MRSAIVVVPSVVKDVVVEKRRRRRVGRRGKGRGKGGSGTSSRGSSGTHPSLVGGAVIPVAAVPSPSSSSTPSSSIDARKVQVEVKHSQRVGGRDTVQHVGEPLHPFVVRQDPVEVDARLADALGDESLVDAAAVGAAGVGELVGERAEDAGHGRDADACAEEHDDVVVGEFLLSFFWSFFEFYVY